MAKHEAISPRNPDEIISAGDFFLFFCLSPFPSIFARNAVKFNCQAYFIGSAAGNFLLRATL